MIPKTRTLQYTKTRIKNDNDSSWSSKRATRAFTSWRPMPFRHMHGPTLRPVQFRVNTTPSNTTIEACSLREAPPFEDATFQPKRHGSLHTPIAFEAVYEGGERARTQHAPAARSVSAYSRSNGGWYAQIIPWRQPRGSAQLLRSALFRCDREVPPASAEFRRPRLSPPGPGSAMQERG